MADQVTSFILENDAEFQKALDRLFEKVNDARIPFADIARHWRQGNRKIFALRGPGLYTDLQQSTQDKKSPNPYPILFGKTGRLASSLTKTSHPDQIVLIGKKALIMGTNTPYAKFHQSDRPRKPAPPSRDAVGLSISKDLLPQRKVIFIDGGPAEKAKDAQVGSRLKAWIEIIEDYITQVVEGKI